MNCFLSYARKDKGLAEKLVKALKNYLTLEIWWDTRIDPGSSWDTTIKEAIDHCDIFLVMLTPNSVESQNVLNEITYAQSKGKTIIPLLMVKCDLPLALIRTQWIDFTHDYTSALDRLLERLQKPLAADTRPGTAGPGTPGQGPNGPGKAGHGPATAQRRKTQIKAIVFILIPVAILISAWIIMLDRPLEGTSILNEAGYKIAYEVKGGNVIFNFRSSDIPSIAVDVNGNKQIDSGVDRSYGLANFSNQTICPVYFLSHGATTPCNGAPSMATLQRSGSRYSFTIPQSELTTDSTSKAVWVQFSFFDPHLGITKLFPARTEMTDFSRLFKITYP